MSLSLLDNEKDFELPVHQLCQNKCQYLQTQCLDVCFLSCISEIVVKRENVGCFIQLL